MKGGMSLSPIFLELINPSIYMRDGHLTYFFCFGFGRLDLYLCCEIIRVKKTMHSNYPSYVCVIVYVRMG